MSLVLQQQQLQAKNESPVAPDSTTVDRIMFTKNEDVLLHDEHGLFIFGTVIQVHSFEEQCLIQFGDDTERWAHFRDLRKVKVQEETEIYCIICKSTQSSSGNQILLCHYCRRGYHQSCHEPVLPSQFANGETNWICMQCMKKRQARERDKLENSKIQQGPVNNNNGSSSSIARLTRKRRNIPYELAHLRWDSNHLTNAERKYCYCGKNGEWFKQMLQCCRCLQWFHGDCIAILKRPLLLGDRFFLFLCSVCNHGKEELLQRLRNELTLTDMAHIALFNLTIETARKYHDLDKAVLPFIDENWNYFQPSDELKGLAGHEKRNRILNSFWQLKNRFMCGRDELKKKKTMWGLRVRTPPQFPTNLSPHSQRTLQLWAHSDAVMLSPSIENTTSSPPVMRKEAESFREQKRPHSSLRIQDVSEDIPSKRARTYDQNLDRNLRIRHQRATSEDSVCEESSDDVKLSVLSIKKQNKRKRTAGADDHSSSMSSPFSVSLANITPVETSSDETSSKGTLDVFIPPPKNFEGLNNPFCNLSTAHSANLRSSGIIFVRPLKTRLSEKDIRITKTGEVKRRRYVRKFKCFSKPDVASTLFPSDSFHLTTPQTSSYDTNKESIMSFFGVEERVSRGEKYTVHARRILSRGNTQYLLQWETDSVT